jgi:hypothetical protein
MKKPTICISLIINNNNNNDNDNIKNILLETLEKLYLHINYWTISIKFGVNTPLYTETFSEFFVKKNINSEICDIYIDEYNEEFDKMIMFERSYNKSDYLLLYDINEYYLERINFKNIHINNLGYYINTIDEDEILNKRLLLFNNKLIWKTKKYSNTYTCVNNINNIKLYELSECDCLFKYLNKIIDITSYNNQTEQIIEYYNNIITEEHIIDKDLIYIIAERYFNTQNYIESLKWYLYYTTMVKECEENIEQIFVSYIKIVICLINNNSNINKIVEYASYAISLQGGRAEPYKIMGDYYKYLNNNNMAKFCYSNASSKDLDNVLETSKLFINKVYYNTKNNFFTRVYPLY